MGQAMSNKEKAVEKFNKETKQAATIKVKTLIIAVLWVATIIGGITLGWFLRSDFANEVRGEVKSQMVVVDLKNNQ